MTTKVCSTVVEHFPRHPKVEGSSPGAVTGTIIKKIEGLTYWLANFKGWVHTINNRLGCGLALGREY
jgi:hypothetical protein